LLKISLVNNLKLKSKLEFSVIMVNFIKMSILADCEKIIGQYYMHFLRIVYNEGRL